MSTVRYFDNIPHIGRYGMLDDEGGSSWTMFYRNGISFNVHVDETDVAGTAFHSLWRPQLGGHWDSAQSMVERHNKFFDMIVSHSLSTLQELAPVKPYWITLRDYLHTPVYTLKLVSDSTGTDGVRAIVTKGPERVGAYDLEPVSAFKIMPQNIQTYSSNDLTALEKEAHWRAYPHKFRTRDGLICYFIGCQKSSREVETGKIRNESLDSIEAHLHIFKYGQEKGDSWAAQRSRVLGIVTDVASVLPAGEESQQSKEPDAPLLAGILLCSPTNSPHIQSLGEVVEKSEAPEDDIFAERVRRWRAQIAEDVKQLHARGLYWGGREDWVYLNQYTIQIDAESDDASMGFDTAALFDDAVSEDERARFIAMDLSAIETVFDEWLPSELSEKKKEDSHVGESNS